MPEPPYLIDPKTIERFDARCTAFARAGQSRPAGRRAPAPGADHQVAAPTIALGDDELALAEARASRRVDHLLRSSLSEAENARPSVEDREARPPYEFANPEDASANVKAVATRFGACLAGVTAVNPLWLYSHDPAGARVELPQGLEFAVVMAVEMDRAQIRQSPGPLASAETGRGYSAMAALTVSLSEYLALLGYRALPSGNDTALSIPLAIDAGLGAMGRNGLLLTSDFGPCVRLCKVFTDLPLKPDVPRADDVEQCCAACGRCAAACPAEAISDAPQPSLDTGGPCNRRGVRRWAVDAERCLAFWEENGTSCSTCIAACPYGLD
jgi:ferredoxin